jgi:pimeloyl-ACP methyl ester carboxylesterase
MEQVEIGRLRVAFERTGRGPAVVLLHGLLGDSRMWRRQLDDLGDEFTVVAWDAPGCGHSSPPPARFRLPEYADCLATLVETLGLVRPHVVGMSFGASLALELYRRHPTRARSLALTAAYPGWDSSIPPDVVAQRLQWCSHEGERLAEPFARPLLMGLHQEAATVPPIGQIPASTPRIGPAGVRVLARAYAAADLSDLPRIEVPTILMYFTPEQRHDPVSPDDEFRAQFPETTMLMLPGVGHPDGAAARDRFHAEVLRFLRTHN